MPEILIVPEEIPTLAEVDFELLEAEIRRIRSGAGSLQQRSTAMDREWAGNVAVHYLAPNGPDLAEKLFPLKAKGATVAEGMHTAADAIQGYVNEGLPIKQRLRRVRADADALVARARPLGPAWEDKPELVEENRRLQAEVRRLVTAHEEAQQNAARNVGIVATDLGTSRAEQVSDYVGWANYGLAGIGGVATNIADGKYGRYAPRGAPGHPFRRTMPLWKDVYQRLWAKNWTHSPAHAKPTGRHRLGGPKPGPAQIRARWGKVGKLGIRGGGVVSAATSGLDQWSEDSAQHPNMSNGKKAARAGTEALGSGLGAWGGAKGGAAVGAAIGSFGGPVGTVVGGVVGGIAGGIIGSEVGSEAADVVNNLLFDSED